MQHQVIRDELIRHARLAHLPPQLVELLEHRREQRLLRRLVVHLVDIDDNRRQPGVRIEVLLLLFLLLLLLLRLAFLLVERLVLVVCAPDAAKRGGTTRQ